VHDPLHYVAEILGEPANDMRNPANADYRCPFMSGICTKSSHQLTEPFPVCTIYRRGRSGVSPKGTPVCVCPNRFLEAQIQEDVIRECWAGDPPRNPAIVTEVSMEKFGTVDFVVVDLNESGTGVREFISVELQAVDITGSYMPAYEAIINNRMMAEPPTYGFNWANVRKRFLSQIVAKGFYHHHWGTRIVAALQVDLFDQFQKHGSIPAVGLEDANIVFLLYQYERDGGRWSLRFQRCVPTTHSHVMTAALYERPPDRAAFEDRILARLEPGAEFVLRETEQLGRVAEPRDRPEDSN